VRGSPGKHCGRRVALSPCDRVTGRRQRLASSSVCRPTDLDGFDDEDRIAVRLRAGPDLDHAKRPAAAPRDRVAGVPRRYDGMKCWRSAGVPSSFSSL
jgi:hypothetical protein